MGVEARMNGYHQPQSLDNYNEDGNQGDYQYIAYKQ